MEQIQELLSVLGEAVRMPIHYFSEECCQASIGHPDGTEIDTPFAHDPLLFHQLRSLTREDALLRDPDEETILYGLVCMSAQDVFVFGPFASLPVTEETRLAYMTRHGMTDFQNFAIPFLSLRQVQSAMKLAQMFARSEERGILNLAVSHQDTVECLIDDASLLSDALEKAEEGQVHHSYRLETEMIHCIQTCDEEKLMDFLRLGGTARAGRMSRSAMKQSEYTAVLLVSFMVRAAIEAHVDPYRAYAINDAYLQQISETGTPAGHQRIILAAVHQLIEEVRRVRTRQRSLPHVERAKQYIRANLSHIISLEELSRAVGVSPSYLSAIFHKQEDMTILEFTLRERVEAAKSMLGHSNATIAQIAAYLCFSSPSHLSGAFKRLTGETPRAYRNKNQIIQR